MSKHILEFIKDNPYVLADGAMGTYFADLSGGSTDKCELANIDAPDIIKRIHEEYITAGAQLLRTNTFAANTWFLKKDMDIVKEVVRKGFEIASAAAKSARDKGRDVYVLADIGPIPEMEGYDVLTEYKTIVDTFFECGAINFIFETFSSYDILLKVCKYIKSRNENAYILTQFAVSPDGYTREGISGERIISAVRGSKLVDSYGFNCRSGPIHLLKYIKETGILSVKNDNKNEDIISIMPNAGYPTIENERTLFLNNPKYFAQIMCDIKNSGAKILGGCCGTTPKHISEIYKVLGSSRETIIPYSVPVLKKSLTRKVAKNSFREKLEAGKKVIAVELDPPLNANVASMLEGAKALKEYGADIITIADSPLARARVDSSILAAKIKREVGIEALPHITCRDRNLNAIKALLLGLHIEDIRNVLAVTGDPIPEAERGDVKGVFNLNSFMLAEFINELNQTEFAGDEIFIGSALNVNSKNFNIELKRAQTKSQKGTDFFMTQPVFSDESALALKKAKDTLKGKILGGILPIVSHRNAIFLNNEIPGIKVPQNIIDQFEDKDREEAESIGINIAVETCKKIIPFVDGLYIITPFSRWKMICKIIKLINENEEL